MSIPFQDSETAKNLLRAFAGESQARNRYDFAANLCQKQELQAMAFIFQATAKQEQAHAKVFWDHLQALNGQNLPIYGAAVWPHPEIPRHYPLRRYCHGHSPEYEKPHRLSGLPLPVLTPVLPL